MFHFITSLYSQYTNLDALTFSDLLNSLWTERTPQTLCSLTVSDQHLDEAAGSTPCPGQKLPQLLCNHQNQKHGGSVWCLPTRQQTFWSWMKLDAQEESPGQSSFYKWSSISARAVDYIRNNIKAAAWSESLVFERLCAIQAIGHVRAANVWEKAPVTRTGSCVLNEPDPSCPKFSRHTVWPRVTAWPSPSMAPGPVV